MVSSLSAPATAAPGGTISLTDTTRNLSGSPAPASSTGFYLSLNSTIDSSDTYLGSRSVSSLAAGGSESGSTTVTIPGTIVPGTYYIVARADWAGLLQESNETNNARASNTMRVGPDFVVSALTVPATAAPASAATA